MSDNEAFLSALKLRIIFRPRRSSKLFFSSFFDILCTTPWIIRMQDENTNSGGKQEKMSHVVKGKNDGGYLMIGNNIFRIVKSVCNVRQWGFPICSETSDNFSAKAIVQLFFSSIFLHFLHVVKGKNDGGYLMIGNRWLFWTRARLWLEMTIESIFADKAMKHSNLTICSV
jgi:hypothetical protein